MSKRVTVSEAALMCDDPDQPAAGEMRPTPKSVVMPPLPTRPPPVGLKPCPPPGVYPNVEFSEYLGWDAQNHSSLRQIGKTPRKYRLAMDEPKDSQTPSKLFGTACHAMLLEPDRFKKSVIAAPVNEKTQKPYGSDTKAWAEYAAQHPGKIILGPDDLVRLAAMKREVDAHPEAAALLKADGPCEVVLVWIDPTTGLRAKARADKLIPGFGLVDIKTTADASYSEFSRSLVEYNYASQCAYYARGINELRKQGLVDSKDHFAFIAIETEPDHGVAVYSLGHDTIAAGDALISEWLAKVAKCQAAGEWPSYDHGVLPIDAPEWWLKRFGQAME